MLVGAALATVGTWGNRQLEKSKRITESLETEVRNTLQISQIQDEKKVPNLIKSLCIQVFLLS